MSLGVVLQSDSSGLEELVFTCNYGMLKHVILSGNDYGCSQKRRMVDIIEEVHVSLRFVKLGANMLLCQTFKKNSS